MFSKIFFAQRFSPNLPKSVAVASDFRSALTGRTLALKFVSSAYEVGSDYLANYHEGIVSRRR